MKRTVLILSASLLASISVNADPGSNIIPLTDYVNTQPLNGGRPRMPIPMPVLYLDGYTLTAGNGTLGSTIQILDENGNVVYSTYIYVEGDIELPATLAGTYTIEVIRGSQTFVGEIVL